MSLSLLKYPPRVSLVDDPVLFKISTGNQYSDAGSKADITLEISAIDTTAGHTCILSCELFTITFTLATSPDDSGTQLPVATAGMSAGAWATNLMTYMKLNYYLDKYYDFSMPLAGIIKLTAKENGDEYTLTFDEDSIVGISESSNNAGTDQVQRDFYKILVSTFQLEGSVKTLLGEDNYIPDDTGIIIHDASEWLKSIPESSFNWPDNLIDLIFKKSGAVKKYFIQYYEYYGIPPLVKILRSSVSKLTYVIPGGLDRMNQALNNFNNTDFYNKLFQDRSFLTWQPKEKVISRAQPEKLFFMVLDHTITELSLMVKVYYTNGSSDVVLKKTVTGVANYDLYEFVVGYNKLNLDDVDPDKIVKQYEVWLIKQDGETVVSEIRKYIPDTKIHNQERAFIFRNSLGWYDTIRVTGELENNNEYDPSMVEMITGPYFTNEDPQVVVAENQESQTYIANTGWTDDIEKVNWFRDFYLSRQVYEVISGILYPVVLTSKKIFIRKDNEYPYSGQFEYMRAWTDDHYAKDANMVYSGPVFTPSFNSSFQPSILI